MSLRNTETSWGSATRALHWLIAVFVVGMLIDGYWMDHFVPREQILGQRHWHAMFGVYFAMLIALRVVWRLANRPPQPESGTPRWEHTLSRLVHGAIYLLVIAIPIAGWLTWAARERHLAVMLPGGIQVPWLVAPNKALANTTEDLHIYMAYTLAALAAFHVAAALWHHFAKNDSLLTRMVTGQESRAV